MVVLGYLRFGEGAGPFDGAKRQSGSDRSRPTSSSAVASNFIFVWVLRAHG